jgi:hypothetical protein
MNNSYAGLPRWVRSATYSAKRACVGRAPRSILMACRGGLSVVLSWSQQVITHDHHELRSLKKDGRFIDIVRTVQRQHPSRRPKVLEEFWERIYEDPMTEAQEEHLSLMGQRLGSYVSILERSRWRGIGFMPPHPRPGTRLVRCSVPGCPSSNGGKSFGTAWTWTRTRTGNAQRS